MHDRQEILVTGGAGFIGTQISLRFKEHWPSHRIIAMDNLKRRGSELNLPRLAAGGVEFIHGDVRIAEDIPDLKHLSLIVECSAEPSVLAGFGGSPDYVIESNLGGAINCLELARKTDASMIFLSTSRVYPVQRIRDIRLEEKETRLSVLPEQSVPGITSAGIDEMFPLDGARSLYGATKYAAELFITEYANMYGLRAVINRCGVIAGPWQMGRVDQGIMALWVARHLYRGELSYIGFGGSGKQVRDMLHVQDLVDLVLVQANRIDQMRDHTFNVGGGIGNSVSLLELTRLCNEVTAVEIPIRGMAEERPADIPYYVTNNAFVTSISGWSPQRGLLEIVEDTARWMSDNLESLRPLLGQ